MLLLVLVVEDSDLGIRLTLLPSSSALYIFQSCYEFNYPRFFKSVTVCSRACSLRISYFQFIWLLAL